MMGSSILPQNFSRRLFYDTSDDKDLGGGGPDLHSVLFPSLTKAPREDRRGGGGYDSLPNLR